MASVPKQRDTSKPEKRKSSGQQHIGSTPADSRKRNNWRRKRSSQENITGRERSAIDKENKPIPKQHKSETPSHVPTLGSPFVQQFNTSSPGADSIHSFQSAEAAQASPISDAGYYSVAESLSARSGCTCTTNMSDLIINTGLEDNYVKGVSLKQISGLIEQEKLGPAVLQPKKQQDGDTVERSGRISTSSVSGTSDQQGCHADPSSRPSKPSLKSTANNFTPLADVPRKNGAMQIRTPIETDGHRAMTCVAPPATSLSPFSEPFFPRQTPRVSSDISDIFNNINRKQAANCTPQDYFLYTSSIPSDWSDSSVSVSSAAEDSQFFADDDYQHVGCLKVRVPVSSHSLTAPPKKDMPSGDSGLYLGNMSKTNSSPSPSNSSEALQASLSPGKSALPTIGEVQTEAQALNGKMDQESSRIPIESLNSPPQLAEEPFFQSTDLTPQVEHRDPLQALVARKLSQSTETSNHDVDATPRKYTVAADAGTKTSSSSTDASAECGVSCHLPMENQARVTDEGQPELIVCDTCQSVDQLFTRTRMLPCHHWACFSCLTASINIVGTKYTKAKCTFCQQTVSDFSPGERAPAVTERASRRAKFALEKLSSFPSAPDDAAVGEVKSNSAKSPIIMRIDNIAWDATPEMVESFLPPNVLAETLQPVHLLIDRRDGKSKDYMFIEVQGIAAARAILQHRQNAVLGTGSRARPVTITLSTEEKLVEELRPESRGEILGLLELCNAAIARNIGHDDYNPKEGRFNRDMSNFDCYTGGDPPPRTGIFLKSRYAPFWCALSIASRLSIGHEVFWDMFLVIAGVVSILAKHLVAASSCADIRIDASKPVKNDDAVQTATGTPSHQHISSNNSTLTPSSSSELHGNASIDPKTADLNARIRERLQQETARESLRAAKRQSTRAYLLGIGDTKQQRNGGRFDNRADSHGGRLINQNDWTPSDIRMLQKFIMVFEEKFGVQVHLKDKA